MQKNICRSGLLLFVFTGLVTLAAVSASAQGSTQGPASQPAAVPAAPPAPADVAAVPADAEKSGSGLAWKVLKPGTGTAHPGLSDTVVINYNAWTTTGRIFDSTDMRKKPSTYVVAKVLPGMAEGLELMTVGEKCRFWMPSELTFNNGPGKPQGMAVFEIELLELKPGNGAALPPPVIAPPMDVAAPPADAQKTASGLASKVLQPGTGTVHPGSTSQVTVHYTLWTPDGQMVESSHLAKKMATFKLNQVIRGWTEGVQLMVEGEKRRFWIPGNLAYDLSNRPDAPKGMLVFDIELIKVVQ